MLFSDAIVRIFHIAIFDHMPQNSWFKNSCWSDPNFISNQNFDKDNVFCMTVCTKLARLSTGFHSQKDLVKST